MAELADAADLGSAGLHREGSTPSLSTKINKERGYIVYMNVVHSGESFQIYGDDIATYEKLPCGTYDVTFSKFRGFYLVNHPDLEVKEEKIYGNSPEKVAKVMHTFDSFDRNCGVILSGAKGIGKSLFARLLAIEGAKQGLPLLLVSSYIPGIADFLAGIDQECIVLFDEFEKTFSEKSDGDIKPQEELLPLFDGIDNGKKLFVITCNEVNKLNSYLLNRPGRFHYHFTMSCPSVDEVIEYLTDKLLPEYHNVIPQVAKFASYVNITFDVLRAIAFELNNGYSLNETLMDLNIKREDAPRYNMNIELSNGEVLRETVKIDIFSGKENRLWLYPKGRGSLRIIYKDNDFRMSDGGVLCIDINQIDVYIDEDDFNDKAEFEAYTRAHQIKSVVATKVVDTYMKYLDF